MASIEEEEKAFKLLLDLAKGKSCVLEKQYRKYSHWDKPNSCYKAYIADTGRYGWSAEYNNPISAVQELRDIIEGIRRS